MECAVRGLVRQKRGEPVGVHREGVDERQRDVVAGLLFEHLVDQAAGVFGNPLVDSAGEALARLEPFRAERAGERCGVVLGNRRAAGRKRGVGRLQPRGLERAGQRADRFGVVRAQRAEQFFAGLALRALGRHRQRERQADGRKHAVAASVVQFAQQLKAQLAARRACGFRAREGQREQRERERRAETFLHTEITSGRFFPKIRRPRAPKSSRPRAKGLTGKQRAPP